ncbi:MAG: NAD(P)-dependent oxidoreductase [Clostridium sp.]
MKILISDYKDELKRDLNYEKKLLIQEFKKFNIDDVIIDVYPYENEEGFIEALKDADVLLTAFLPISTEVLDKAEKLKCISINATGYGIVDLHEASKRNIAVCNVKEYCTQEVAEHTMALMLAMTRRLKQYGSDVNNGIWNYNIGRIERLAGKTLAIFGLGRIGQAVAKRAQGFDLNVIAVDPYLPKEVAEKLNVKLVSKEEALKNADIISNHMNQTSENKSYFSIEEFKSMERRPYFLNVGRGECVDEDALREAMDKHLIRGAALDVLKDENPDLKNNPLLDYEDLYLTPHAAFYSETSMKELQRISCENIVYYMTKQYEKVFGIVNPDIL